MTHGTYFLQLFMCMIYSNYVEGHGKNQFVRPKYRPYSISSKINITTPVSTANRTFSYPIQEQEPDADNKLDHLLQEVKPNLKSYRFFLEIHILTITYTLTQLYFI